jgi:hypothetical protein
MKNQTRVIAGLIVSLMFALSACAQQANKGMAESDMMPGQKTKAEAGMMDTMDKMNKDATIKKEQMKDQKKDVM